MTVLFCRFFVFYKHVGEFLTWNLPERTRWRKSWKVQILCRGNHPYPPLLLLRSIFSSERNESWEPARQKSQKELHLCLRLKLHKSCLQHHRLRSGKFSSPRFWKCDLSVRSVESSLKLFWIFKTKAMSRLLFFCRARNVLFPRTPC